MSQNVAFHRPELAALLPMYKLIRDALAGEPTVKAAGIEYLPMPNPHDDSKENRARYEAYRTRAVFYNVARGTLRGLIGQIFMREPIVTVPTQLDTLVKNATGEGLSIVQLAKRASMFTLAYSRCGLFIDYPQTDSEGVTVEQVNSGMIRPTMYVYSPNEIVNWRTVERGAEVLLSLVVIFETYGVYDDGFETKNSPQFRVLKLDENGHYVCEVWREPQPTEAKGLPPKRGNFQKVEVFNPKDVNGAPMTRIPFTFIGAENNDSSPDNPAFYDLASLNIAHYRNSADYEESCFIVGQPTPVLAGLTEEWVTSVLKGTVNFGSRGGIPLPVGAQATLLQAQPNTMLKEAMDTKERQMVALGAKLVEQKQVQRTATEASLDSSTESSTLSNVSRNVSDAFEWGLKFAATWIGANESGIQFALNSDFDVTRATPDERAEIVKEWQAGAISWTEMRDALRKAGIATQDDDIARAQIQSEMIEQLKLVEDNDNNQNQDSDKAAE